MRTVLIATAAFVFHLTEMPPAKPASTVSWQGGFFRYREIYPDGLRRWWLGNAGWREPTSSDRLPSIGVSLQPAIPRRVAPQQSPLPLHQSPTIVAHSRSSQAIKCAAQFYSRDAVQVVPVASGGCYFYFARRVKFLSCTGIGPGLPIRQKGRPFIPPRSVIRDPCVSPNGAKAPTRARTSQQLQVESGLQHHRS